MRKEERINQENELWWRRDRERGNREKWAVKRRGKYTVAGLLTLSIHKQISDVSEPDELLVLQLLHPEAEDDLQGHESSH